VKLTTAQPAQKFPAFYETQKFITSSFVTGGSSWDQRIVRIFKELSSIYNAEIENQGRREK
jgi:hypothetical protein